MLQRIATGRTDLVFDFIAGGRPATATDDGGVKLIRWCSYFGDVSAIRFLLQNGETLESLGWNRGLNEAAFHGHWRLCQYLLENGADANLALPETAETPLHLALCKANRPAATQVVVVLLAAGAKADVVTLAGAETGAFMRDIRTRGETPLHRAAAFGDEEAIDLLLAAGAQINVKDCQGESPLTWASWHLRPDAILRKLCYGDFRISPQRHGQYDHGRNWGTLDAALLGEPLAPDGG
jgi:ankyrin repeat protein